ncbi:ATP-binding protein [Candidatus Chlorohelix allophototropha]|uniref:ATP-binding protein n=1 Tax=Candidatus Chlorohelix allophototropha TaxID=3003348 RepID=A0ABY9B6E0_9CHLR|nr:ATP-binding protein [Chloroflexota bacterium L227-S17]
MSMLNNYPNARNFDSRLRNVERLISEPTNIQETEISQRIIGDLVIKLIYQITIISAQKMAETIKLPYFGVVEPVINQLRKAEIIDIGGSEGLGESAYQYVLTPKGVQRALEVINHSSYVGPAPVSLDQYRKIIKAQTFGDIHVGPQQVREALLDMVVGNDIVDSIGPAINTGRSMFLYGPAGNGKTLLSEHVARLLGGDVYIPYAMEADGFVIKVFDQNLHVVSGDQRNNYDNSSLDRKLDSRWVLCKRPVIVVGGELSLGSLDLIWDDTSKYYEAPFQLKSNNGMFLIDDFGRQQMRPRDLLNRWIVPLEKRMDFLTLRTGKKIEVPFDELIVFSTNLAPRDLVDEAFLRRIQNKIEVRNPTYEEYREILRRQCEELKVSFTDEGAVYLLKEHYVKARRELRNCHPRDLLKQILGISSYLGAPATLTKDLIDQAVASYFVEL